MSITGVDSAGISWEGEVDLDVNDDGEVSGTITWTSSSHYYGSETVEGTLRANGDLRLDGTSVTGSGIVPCRYEGTWIDGQIDIDWVGECPFGSAEGDDDESGDGDGDDDDDNDDESGDGDDDDLEDEDDDDENGDGDGDDDDGEDEGDDEPQDEE